MNTNKYVTKDYKKMKPIMEKVAKGELNLGQLIYIARTNKGLSQRELAKLSEVNYASISKVESNQRNPSPKMLRKISRYIGVHYCDLLYFVGLHSYSYFNPILIEYHQKLTGDIAEDIFINYLFSVVGYQNIINSMKNKLEGTLSLHDKETIYMTIDDLKHKLNTTCVFIDILEKNINKNTAIRIKRNVKNMCFRKDGRMIVKNDDNKEYVILKQKDDLNLIFDKEKEEFLIARNIDSQTGKWDRAYTYKDNYKLANNNYYELIKLNKKIPKLNEEQLDLVDDVVLEFYDVVNQIEKIEKPDFEAEMKKLDKENKRLCVVYNELTKPWIALKDNLNLGFLSGIFSSDWKMVNHYTFFLKNHYRNRDNLTDDEVLVKDDIKVLIKKMENVSNMIQIAKVKTEFDKETECLER